MQTFTPVLSRLFKWSLAFACFLLIQNSYAATYYWVGGPTANWNAGGSWSTALGGSGGAVVPGVADDVRFDGSNIGAGATGPVNVVFTNGTVLVNSVTLTNFTSASNAVTFQANAAGNSLLTVSSTSTLVAANNFLIITGNANRNMTVQSTTGLTLSVEGTVITRSATATTGFAYIIPNGGTLNVSSSGTYEHQKDEVTIPVATWTTGSKFIWNVAAQAAGRTISSVLSGPAVTIANSNNQNVNIAGTNSFASLTIGSVGVTTAKLDLNSSTTTIAGATTIYGSLLDGSGTGTNTYSGPVTIAAIGTLSMTGTSANNFNYAAGASVINAGAFNAAGTSTYLGGIDNSGTFTPSGASIFTGTQTLTGAGTYTFGGTTTVSTGTLTNDATTITHTGTFTISSGAVYDASQSSVTFNGAVIATGTFNDGNIAGTNTFNSTVTVTATTGTFNLASTSATTFKGTITNNNSPAFTVSGNTTFSPAANINLAGNNPFTFASVQLGTAFSVASTGTGMVTMASLNIVSGATYNSNTAGLTVNGATSIFGTLSDNSGTGTNNFAGTVTVQTGGSVNALQSVSNFNNTTLAVSNSGTFGVAGAATFAGPFTNNASSTVNSSGASNYQAGISNNGSFSPTGANTVMGGIVNNGTFSPSAAAAFTFTSAGSQSLSGSGSFPFLNNVTVSTGTLSAGSGTVSIAGTLNISTGATFDAYQSTFSVTGAITTTGTGAFADTDNGGSNIFNSTVTIAATGSFTSASTAGTTFKNTITNNSANTFTVNGPTTFSPGAAMNIAGNNPFQFNGHVEVSTSSVATTGSSTVTLGSSASHTFTIASGATFNASAATLTVNGPTTVTGTFNDNNTNGSNTFNGDVTIGGTWVLANPSPVNIGGNFTINTIAANFSPGGGLYTFSGASKSIGGSLTPVTITNGTVSGTITTTIPNLTITTLVVAPTGNFKTGGFLNVTTATINAIDASTKGILEINGANATLNVNTSVTNNGVFKLLGTGNTASTVAKATDGSGNFTFTQAGSFAEFNANNYEFTNLGTNGVTISAGTITSLDNGTFSSGIGNAYITLTGLSLPAPLTVNNVVFNAGPTYNVQKPGGSNAITFNNSTGSLAGYFYENDDASATTGFVQWTGGTATGTYYWIGGTSAANWDANNVWSTTLGGPPSLPGFTPGPGHTFVFDGTNLGGGVTGNVTAIVNNNYTVGGVVVRNFPVANSVTLQAPASANRTLTLAPTTSNVFTVAALNTLNIVGNATGTRTLTVTVGNNSVATLLGIVNVTAATGAAGLLNTSGTGAITFKGYSKYNHNVNGGTIPTATWGDSTEATVNGATSTMPLGTGQNFGRFTWRATGQSATLLFGTDIGTKSIFKVSSTNGQILQLRNTAGALNTFKTYRQEAGNVHWNVAGNATTVAITDSLDLVGGTLNVNTSTSTATISIGTLLSQAGGILNLVTGSGTTNFTVNGNIAQTGGAMDLAATGATGTGNLIVGGNITQSNTSAIQRTAGNTISAITFNGTTTQNLTSVSGGFGVNPIVFNVNKTGSILLGAATTIPSTSTLNLTLGVVDLNGKALTFGSGATINRSGGNFSTNGGTYSYNSGSLVNVVYSGTTSINSGAEIPTAAAGLGTLTVNTPGATVTMFTNSFPNGNVNVTAGTLDLQDKTMNANVGPLSYGLAAGTTLLVGGTNTLPITYTYSFAPSSTVHYNGATQSVFGGTTYGNLIVSGTGDKALAATASIAGNVSVNSAILFDLDTKSLNRTAAGGSFTMVGGAKLKIKDNTFPTNYGTVTLAATSTVDYSGTTSVVSVVTYGNLLISSGTVTTLSANTTYTINGTLEVNGVLNYGATANQTLNVAGNFLGVGTLSMVGSGTKILSLSGHDNSGFTGTYNAASGTVSYASALTDQILFAGSYNTLSFTSPASNRNRTLSGPITVAQNFTVPANITLNLNGFVLTSNGTSTVSASGVVNVGAASTLASTGAITVGGTLTVKGINSTLTSSANTTINAGGTLDISDNAVFNMNGATIANNGTFKVVGGSASSVARVTSTGNYLINQTGGGAANAVFHAKFYVFDKLGTNGITISTGASGPGLSPIDITNNFSNGTFSNGAGNAYLTLSALNFTNFTANSVVFGSTATNPTKNVVRTSGSGTISFVDYSGTIGGQAFETDNAIPGTLITWSISGSTFYSKSSGGFFNLNTWSSTSDGLGSQPSDTTKFKDGSSNFIIQATHTVTVNNDISVKDISVLANGNLVIGNSTAVRTILIGGNVNVAAAGTVSVGNFVATHQIYFQSPTASPASTLVNDGTFNLYLASNKKANVFFNGVDIVVSGANSPIFAGVNFNNQVPPFTSNKTTAAVPFIIKGDVQFYNNGLFVDGGLTHKVAGDWAQASANQMTATGTISFNGTTPQAINSVSTFNNLTFEGGNAPQIAGIITVNGKLYITNNTAVATGNLAHVFNGDFEIDNGSSFNQSNGTATFSGTSAQNIDFKNATFFGVQFSNAGVKSTINNLMALSGVGINAGAVVNGSGSHTLTGDLRIDGTCNWNGQVTMLGGNLRSNNATATLPAQLNISGTVTLVNVTAANPLTLTLGGNLNVNSGTFIMSVNALLSSSDTANTLSVANGAVIRLLGANNFPSNFNHIVFATGSNARYLGTSPNQIVAGGISYYNLNVENNSKEVSGPIAINGNLDFGSVSNTVLDLKKFKHTIAGNVSNATTAGIAITSTGAGAGSFTFNNPNANQTIGAIPSLTVDTLAFTLDAPTATRTKTINNGAGIVVNSLVTTNTGGTSIIRLILDLGTNVVNTNGVASSLSIGKNTSLYTSGATSLATVFTNANFSTLSFNDSSAVRYTGTAQTIASRTGVSYGSLELAGSGAKTATQAVDVNANVLVAGGTPIFVDGGFSHTVGGNWSVPVANYSTTTSPASSGTIVLDGLNQNIMGGFVNLVAANGGTKSLTTGTVTIDGNLTVNSGVAMDANTQNVVVRGNWAQLGTGVFTQTTGTTTFNGINASAQNITIATPRTSTFGNLTITRGSGSTPSPNIKVVTYSSVHIAGRLDLSYYINAPTCTATVSFADLDITGDSIFIGADFVVRPSTNVTGPASTIVMDGNNAQIFYLANNATTTFNNILFTGNGTKTFADGNICAAFNWASSFLFTGDFAIDLSTVDARARPITVSGNWINTGDFQHTGVVTLKGLNKTISNSTFYSLDLNSGVGIAGRRTLTGDITVNQDLNIRASDTLDVSASNYAINVVRNWTNAGSFYARKGTVNITSGGMTLNSGGVGPLKSFYNLNITNAACGNTTTLADSLNVTNDLTINTGVLTTAAFNVKVGKNFYNYDQYNQSGASSRLVFTNVFTGTRAFVCTTSTAACGGSTYRKINIEAGSGSKIVQSGDILINDAALTVLSGAYKLNGNQVDFSNGANSLVTIASGATLDVDSGASLLVRNTITNNGTFRLVGTVSAPAMLGSCTACGNGNGYTFVQTASGTIKARYYTVDSKFTSNVANTLLDIQGGAIDPADNLSYGTFSNTTYTCTAACTTSAYIKIAPAVLTSNYTLKGVVFNAGKPRNVNISTPAYAGGNTLSFQLATGSNAGAAYELDNPSGGATTGYIRWSYVGAKFWSGLGGDGLWGTANNWQPIGAPVPSDTVFLDNTIVPGNYSVLVDVVAPASATAARLIMQRTGASIITLNVSNKTLEIGTSLSISPGCTLNGGSGNINVGASWSNSGSFVAGTSKVLMKGTGTTYSIASGGSAFNDLTLAGTLNTQYILSSPLTVNNNVTINSGNTLDVSSLANNVTVGGNWLNNGTFNPRNGTAATITFNKAGNQTISGGPFNLFVTAGTGTKQLLTNVIINRDVTIGSGTVLDAQDMNIYVGRNWINNATAGFSQILGSTVYFNGANQSIDNGTTATSFKNVTLLGTGTKTLFKNSGIDGDFLISPAGLVFNMQDYQLMGNGTTSQFTISSNSRVDVGGSGLFLNNFADVSLAVNSTIRYIPTSAAYDANQTILSLPNSKSYGNIDLRTRTSPSVTPANKNLIGNVVIDGTLTIGDVTTQLNVAGYTISLDGNLSFPTGGLQINWPNGSTGTLVHTGTATYNWQNSWNIDPDLLSFNNLVLSGSQRKTLNSNVNVYGDLTIQGNVIFDMDTCTVTGTSGKSLLMQSASRLESAISQPTTAFPSAFGTYNLNPGSTTVLDGNRDQRVATRPVYGNLIFNNTITSTAGRVMTLGNNNLVVASDLSLTNTKFDDNGKNVTIAGDFNTNDYYVPSTTSRLTLNGDAQTVRNTMNAPTVININKLTITGTGIKTIGNGAVTVNINDSLFVDTSLVLNTARPLVFSGKAWYNYGSMALTNSTTFRNKTGKVMVYAGASDPANYFSAVTFNTLDTVSFIWNGADFNGAFNVDSGVVNMGNGLTHTMAGAIRIASEPTSDQWITKNANLIFDGGGQIIPVPLTARNVTLSNAGTKTMLYRWRVADLTINTGVTLYNTVDSLFVSGNWLNNGTYTAGNTAVVLNATSGNKTIYGGTSNFYDLSIAPLSASIYRLTSPSTRVAHKLDVVKLGKLKLNSNTLIHGLNNIQDKTLFVEKDATLEVDTNAFLLFDNRNYVAKANIQGTLKVMGSSTNVATISRFNTGGHELNVNGPLFANNYLIEYTSPAGLNLGNDAKLDPVYNLSNGTFSFLNATAGSTYVTSSMVNTPTDITNVIFNYVGTPSAATTHNIIHTGSSTITFVSPIAGALACPAYSVPANGALNVNGGKVIMPNCTIATWIGVLDDDWSKGGNWSTGLVPDSQTDVFIPKPVAPYQANLPVVSVTNATARNITIVNGSLSLSPNAVLDATGDVLIGTAVGGALSLSDSTSVLKVKGNWTKNTNGSFSYGSASNPGTVQFYSNGSISINNGTVSFGNLKFTGSGVYNIATTSLDVRGSIALSNGTFVPPTGTLTLGGNFVRANGIYNPIGTINFNGTATQVITNGSFNNIVLSGNNSRVTNGALSIAGTTSVTAGSLVASSGSVITMNGNVTFTAGTTFNDGGSTHIFNGGTWSSPGITTLGIGRVRFNAGNQTINASNLTGVILAGTGTKTIAGNVSLTGELNVSDNITLNVQTFLIQNTGSGIVMTVGNNSVVNVSGANNFPSGFGVYDIKCNATVNYNSSVLNQTIASVDYGHLTVTGGAPTYAKLLNGGISVCGNLTIAANTTLDVTPSNFNITIAGNFINSSANGSFLARQGQVLFSGTNAQSVNIGVSGLSGNKAFYEFRQNKPSGTVSFASTGTVRINSHLTVLGGNLSLNGPDTVYVGGDVKVTGAIVNNTYNLTLKAETPGAYALLTSGSIVSNVQINSPGSTYTLQDNLSINRNLDLKAGTLVVGDKVLTLGDGNLRTANIYDKVTVDAGGTVALANNMTFNVNTTGSFDLIGVPGKIATVTSSAPGSRYNFNVDGRIKASNYLFEYMRASGVSLSATSIIAPYPHNFSDGTFANGTSGGVYLKIENTQDVSAIDTIRNVGFTNNPGGGARNVAKTVATSGKMIFHNAIGAFAGENYENDPYSLVFWTGNYTLNWIGAVNTDWYNPLNWSPAFVPTANDNAIIQVASNQPTIRDVKTGGLPGVCRNLIINLGAELSLNSTDAKRDLVVTSDITINGVLKLNNATDTVYVGGNWQRGVSGSVPAGNGTVVLYASSGVKTVNNRSSSFGNLILNGAASFQLGSSTVISKSLNIRTGTLDVTNSNNYSLKVGGNWVNNGVFQARGGTVTLNGTCASTYTFDPGVSGKFNSLIIAACTTSVYNLAAHSLFVNNTFTLTSGVFNVNSLQVNVGDGVGSDALDISGTFNMNEFSNLKMGASSAISVLSGGVFKMKGIDSSKVASVSLQSTGTYSFVVNSGASISASFYSINGLTAAGLVLRSGATVDPLNNLSNGDFSGGAPSGTYITFQNNYSSAPAVCDTIRKVTFASGPSKNATRITGTGCVAFKDAAGSLAGYLFEKDELTANANAGLLRWAYTNPILFWTGNAKNNDWFDYNNWEDAAGVMGGRIPDNRTIVEIPTDPKVVPDNFPEIRANNVLCATVCGDTAFARNITIFRRKSNTDTTNNLRIRDGLKLIVNGMFNNTGGRVTVAANSGSKIIVARDFTVADNATPAVGGIFNAGNANMDVYGSWLVSGTFNGGTSTVNMTSAGGTVQFSNRGGSLNNLNFTGPSTFQLPSAVPDTMKVAKNVTISNVATLTNARTSRVFVVGGNWTNNGTFNHGSGKVSFNGTTGTQVIDGTSLTTFSALDMYGAATKQLARPITVAGNFTIGGSSAAMATMFDMNGKDVTMNGSAFDVQFTSTKIKHGGAGTFTFSSPSNQTVSVAGLAATPPADKAFFNLVKAGAGTLTMNTAIDIDGNLNINAGTLNSGSKQINIAGNWNNAGSFTYGTGTVVFDGVTQSITKSPYEYLYNLTLANGSVVTLGSVVGIANQLALGSGFINATTYELANESTLPATRTTGYVIGKYRRYFSATSSRTFEVGAAGQYTPITISPSTSSTGYVYVTAKAKDSPNITASCFDTSKTVERSWTITKLSFAANLNITFNYSSGITNAGVVPSTLGLAAYNPSTWTAIPVVANPTATSLTANNVALTGEFQIGQYANTSLAITSSAPGNVICTGTNVTFTATPSFNAVQWKLNNANVGTATPTYSSSTLANGDQVKITTTAACLTPTTSNTITMVVNTNNNWTGLVDNKWSRPSNWGCGLVPNSTRDAVIANVSPNAFPVISDTTNAIAANVTINSSATLTIANKGKLQVYGNWSNAGNFVPNTGTVEFTGTAAQTVTKSSAGNLAKFYNLTVNKASGTVTVGATTNVDINAGGTLQVSSGTFNLNSRTVTLKSWAPAAYGLHKIDSTARLGRVSGTITNSTNFAIERYIPTPIETTGRAYTKVRYVASPLQSVAAAQWADSISIYGGSGAYAFKTLTGWNPAQSTLQSYYEPSTLGNVSRGFRPVLDNRTNMNVGQGYSLTVGFDGNIAYSKYGVARPYVILKSKGIPTVGDFSQTLSKSGADPYGWNLVGNPYPSEIDWDLVWAANQTTVSSTVSQFDPQGGVTSGQYYYYNARTGKTVDPRYSVDSSVGSARLNKSLIASSQGFFVFARNQGSSTILFKEAHKPLVASKVVSSYRVGDAIATVNIGVSNGTVHDNTLIYLDNSANTYGFDADLDAFKSTNSSLNVFTSSFGKDFAMNGISPEDGVDVPVSVTASAKGTYRMTVRLEDGDLISTRLYLKDNTTGTLTELTSASQSFPLEVLTNGSTVKRFSIVSNGGNVVTGTPESVSTTASGIAVYPNPVTGDKLTIQMSKGNGSARQVEIMDLNGVLVYKTETQNMSASFAVQGLSDVLSSGVYTVRVVSEDGVKQQKFVYLK